MSAPTPTPIPGTGSDPSVTGSISGVLTAVLLWLVDYFALPVDDTTKLVIAGIVALVAPLVAALVIRLRAWEPASVAKLQDQLFALWRDSRTAEPNVVTREPMTPVQAAEAHPGALGLSGTGDDETGLEVGTEDGQPGRHVKRKGLK